MGAKKEGKEVEKKKEEKKLKKKSQEDKKKLKEEKKKKKSEKKKEKSAKEESDIHKKDFEILDQIISETVSYSESKKRKLENETTESEPPSKKNKLETNPDDKDKRTLFLSQVPDEYTNDKVRSKFEKFGPVEEVRRLHDKLWVQFAKKETLENVLESKDSLFKNSKIEVSRAKTEVDERCSIFISNLSFKTTEKSLINVFNSCGEISQVKIPVFPDSGKSRGIAYVIFESEESVEKALRLNVKNIDGRSVKVVKSDRTEKSRPSKVDYSNSIWIGNLSNFTTNEQIKDFFSDCGMILDIRREVFPDTGKPKNHAFVDLDSSAAVERAMALNGSELNGKNMRIDYGSRK